jgi:midasin (ATPase involved in ribosome maturation)
MSTKSTMENLGLATESLVEELKKSIEESSKKSVKEDRKTVKKPEFTGGSYKTINGYYRVSKGLLAVVERNVDKNVSTLLLGPTGVGKTELVSNLAKIKNLPLTIFDMGTMSDPIMSLVGTHIIKMEDGKTTSTFVKSRFSEMIQKPGIILLDELSRASATANNLLFPCLDFRRELPMEYCFEDAAPIKVHPECVFFATANLGGQYTGTHKLDRALMDRFMLVEIDPLTSEDVTKAITIQNPKMDPLVIAKMVDVYTKINNAHDEFVIGFNLSIRHLKLIAALVEDGFTLYDSFYIICKGIGGPDGLKALETILNTAK